MYPKWGNRTHKLRAKFSHWLCINHYNTGKRDGKSLRAVQRISIDKVRQFGEEVLMNLTDNDCSVLIWAADSHCTFIDDRVPGALATWNIPRERTSRDFYRASADTDHFDETGSEWARKLNYCHINLKSQTKIATHYACFSSCAWRHQRQFGGDPRQCPLAAETSASSTTHC